MSYVYQYINIDAIRLTNTTKCQQIFKSIIKYTKKKNSSCANVSKSIKTINQLGGDKAPVIFETGLATYLLCVHHRVNWTTCVTRGSRSLSTVRVRISRLLGSHFNRMGEVAVVMVSVRNKKHKCSE